MEVFLTDFAGPILAGVIVIAAIIRIILVHNNMSHTNETSDNDYIDSFHSVIGNFYYEFVYKYKNNAWRAYIKTIPSLRGRDSSGYVIHLLTDNNHSRYICTIEPLNSILEAKEVAHLWAECLSQYILTGKACWNS